MSEPSSNPPQDVHFELFDCDIRGLRWGRPDSRHKVIALHGWLDNCASFSRLLPYVDDIDCVAIDMAGHGKSSARTGHSAYNIWEDLRDVRDIAAALGWETFSLLGHSRGAAVATLYAGTLPEDVRGAFLIDGLFPLAAPTSELAENLASSIRAMSKARHQSHRRSYFENYDDAVAARMNSRQRITRAAAAALAERAVRHDPKRGYFWQYDQRLKVPSEIKLSQEQCWSFLDRLPCKIIVVAASNGFLPGLAPAVLAHGHGNVELLSVEGDHHLHLLDDEPTRVQIAQAFAAYLASRAG